MILPSSAYSVLNSRFWTKGIIENNQFVIAARVETPSPKNRVCVDADTNPLQKKRLRAVAARVETPSPKNSECVDADTNPLKKSDSARTYNRISAPEYPARAQPQCTWSSRPGQPALPVPRTLAPAGRRALSHTHTQTRTS